MAEKRFYGVRLEPEMAAELEELIEAACEAERKAASQSSRHALFALEEPDPTVTKAEVIRNLLALGICAVQTGMVDQIREAAKARKAEQDEAAA